jgi:hypothetical protein
MKAVLIGALALALTACDRSDAVSEGANNVAGLNAAIEAADEGAEAAHDNAVYGSGEGFNLTSTKDPDTSAGMPILPEDARAATIPAQYQGRWGMVPADCTSTRGDAKGLIVVGERMVRFYESVATLKEQRPSAGTSFSGLFAFEGEGQKWQKVMTFTRSGNTLVRAEEGGRFTYKRCG